MLRINYYIGLIITVFVIEYSFSMEDELPILETSGIKSLKELVAHKIIRHLSTNIELKKNIQRSKDIFPQCVLSEMIRENLSLFLTTLPCKKKIFYGHKGSITAVAFSANGKYALSGSEDCSVRLWDLETGQCLKIFEGHVSEISALAFHPSGQLIASGSIDGNVRVWNIEQEKCVHNKEEFMDGEVALIRAIKKLFFQEDTLKYYTFDELGLFSLKTLAFDSNNLITVKTGKKFCIMYENAGDFGIGEVYIGRRKDVGDIKNNFVSRLSGNFGEIWCGKINSKDTLVFTGSNTGIVNVWDLKTGKCLKIFQRHLGPIVSIAFGEDERTIFVLSTDGYKLQIISYNLQSGKKLKNITLNVDQAPLELELINDDEYYVTFIDGTKWKICNEGIKKINYRALIDNCYPLIALPTGNAEIYKNELLKEKLYMVIFDEDNKIQSRSYDFVWNNDTLFALFGLTDNTFQLWTLVNPLDLEQLALILEIEESKKQGQEIKYDETVLKTFEEQQQKSIKDYSIKTTSKYNFCGLS